MQLRGSTSGNARPRPPQLAASLFLQSLESPPSCEDIFGFCKNGSTNICRYVRLTFVQPRVAQSLLLEKRIEGLVKAIERQRDADFVAAGVSKGKFASADSRAEFQHIVLDIEVREAAIRRAACERGRNAGIGVAGLDSDVDGEGDVDRHLHNKPHRLTFHRMRNSNARKRQVPPLDLRALRDVADFLARLLGLGFALDNPIRVGGGRSSRRFASWWLNLRRALGGGAACARHQQSAANEYVDVFHLNLLSIVRGIVAAGHRFVKRAMPHTRAALVAQSSGYSSAVPLGSRTG